MSTGSGRMPTTSVDRMLDLFHAGWGFLVVREAFFGVRRFAQFQSNLGISKAILSQRLQEMVDAGVMERREYQTRPRRSEYVLTESGLELYPIFVAMMRWGDRWLDDGSGPPLLLTHDVCGRQTSGVLVCEHCGEQIDPRQMRYEPGPGMRQSA